MFGFLRNHGKLFAEWGTFIGVLVACYGVYVANGQLKANYAQLEQANDQRRWQNYNELNVRYAELYKELPKDIAERKNIEFQDRPHTSKRWVRQYFDLYSEEYWLYANNLIPKEMWTQRIYCGVRVNLNAYPAVVEGYAYWKMRGSFTHPQDFRAEVEKAIAEARAMASSNSKDGKCPGA